MTTANDYIAERIAEEAERRLLAMRHVVNGLGGYVADLVTCSECLYCAAPAESLWCAKFGAYRPSADGFCAWGERRRA